jgi:inosine/xanthosine triphosphatase
MLTVLIASTNPVKIKATEISFTKMFPHQEFTFTGINVPSGVSDQPMSSEETLTGARNRARALHATHPEADYCIGLEGGLMTNGDDLVSLAWMVIINKVGQESKSSTATFVLPKLMADDIRTGMELGAAADKLHGTLNVKQNLGTVGILTHGVIDRTDYYVPAIVLALIPFTNPDLYL